MLSIQKDPKSAKNTIEEACYLVQDSLHCTFIRRNYD